MPPRRSLAPASVEPPQAGSAGQFLRLHHLGTCHTAAAGRLKVEITASVVVGDSVWDLLASQRALGIGLLSGGYGQDELEPPGVKR